MAAPALADARDADGLTPLHLAVVHGNVPLVQTLLAAGADVNAKDNEHHTVVHWATVCGEVGALRAVLAAGADAATPDQHGGYPLHYAAQMCGAPAATDHQSRGAALEVLRALVKEGDVRVDVRDADGRTPLLWAASAGSASAVLALHQAGARVDDADRDGLTALHCAAARGHTEALETLVGLCGARVDVADSHGCTPLHYAAALGHADATSALLEHEADAHRQDRRGRSPAHTAAAKGQIETVRILGARGANLWLRNSKGDLPLHEAVASGRRELVKWLLDGRPSQVNATNHEGRTPLHIAAATDNADLCRLLLDRGAEVNYVARSSKNEPITPLDCATIRGHRSTAKYIQMHGGLPASKLPNTQIIIDNTPISNLPTRRVTSTKIDLRDKIRIEKREVVELSSPLPERRRIREASDFNSDSSEDHRTSHRRHDNKYCERKKRLIDSKQKSFSDGYDSEIDACCNHAYYKQKITKGSRSHKSRSRSEPSKRNRNSPRYHRRYRSISDSSSEISSSQEKKRSKRHKKRNKKKVNSTSDSSTESSERRSTKRKGKKTSIHIENDDLKQSVNIVKYKNIDCPEDSDTRENLERNVSFDEPSLIKGIEIESSKDQQILNKQSETETDTVSVKTNMVVTEAQIHMERESSQHGSSELTVTVDSLNNVSIETSNLSVTQTDLKEIPGDQRDKTIEHVETITNEKEETKFPVDTTLEVKEVKESKIEQKVSDEISSPDKEIGEKDSSQLQSTSMNEEEPTLDQSQESKQEDKQKEKESLLSTSGEASETSRKRSFQVLSGPEKSSSSSKEMPQDTLLSDANKDQSESQEKSSPSVSFSNKDEIFKIKDSVESGDTKKESQEEVAHKKQETLDDKNIESLSLQDVTTNVGSQIIDKGILSIIKDEGSEVTDINLSLTDTSPKFQRKSLKDSHTSSSRKSSIYETESYKVLSETTGVIDSSPGILKKRTTIEDTFYDEDKEVLHEKVIRQSTYGRVPSVSDNEIYYSHSEANGKRKRFRKKGRSRSRITIRSKSENSERGYESSGVMDSGFEPSPRPIQRCIISPRLNAYYAQRKSGGKFMGKFDSKIPVRKPGDKNAVDMRSVTQRIQTNMRRYYCERKIFQHLLELKRLQIRTSKANEAVLVKRAIDEYNKSSLAHVGLGSYNSTDYSFSSFEKFLYHSLRKLQRSGKKHLDNLPEKPIDFDYGESELYKMSAIPDNPCLCTSKTHRCFHAIHAYTGIPCSAYIPYKWNHHTMPKPATAGPPTKSKNFLPKINTKPSTSSGKAHVTLEVSHGTEKQLIALPAERLDKNKRYYVTFTVKGSEPPSDNDNASPTSAKVNSVRSD
ncbi:ankycorbin [Zerene cesonia]|uniref:ankycorbin n=1 Tax=Zerene cesonia TaxID=33412 RepID=UPI0018E589CE|nr:ankycorbin [Zerene cesonia]